MFTLRTMKLPNKIFDEVSNTVHCSSMNCVIILFILVLVLYKKNQKLMQYYYYEVNTEWKIIYN